MNPVTFNEPFAEILDELLAMRGFFSPSWQWETSPLFNYSFTEQREETLTEWRTAHPDFRMRLPFESVRLALRQSDADAPTRGCYVADFLAASRQPDCDLLYLLVRVKKMFDRTVLSKEQVIDFVLTDIEWQSREPAPVKGYMVGYNAMGRINGVWIKSPIPDAAAEMLNAMITGAMNCFVSFAIDAMLPGTHVAQVHPDQPHRSVQWIRQRTHYTLISHGHPANRADVKHGATVRVNQVEELKRMAHARRAHFRTLKAERFRFARGSQIFVRASWVGPKEWRDDGSRQIYKILEEKKEVMP